MDSNELYKNTFIKIVEDAAIASYEYAGSGDDNKADFAAVSSMRNNLQNIKNLKIKVAIGEGERDDAPMLYINEIIGDKNAINTMEIAVDPLEGTSICADYKPGAITVLAYGKEGTFLRAPDCYMNKLIVGASLKNADISIDYSVYDNLRNISKEKSCNINDIVVVILKRERNQYIVDEIRKCGAKIRFIDDGDIAVALEFILQNCDFLAVSFIGDVYMGIGGAPEGILAATAIKNMGGKMQGKLLLDTPHLCEYASRFGIDNYNKVYNANDFVKKDAVLVISGVTSGNLLNGIKYIDHNKLFVNSMVFEKDNCYLINKVKKYG